MSVNCEEGNLSSISKIFLYIIGVYVFQVQLIKEKGQTSGNIACITHNLVSCVTLALYHFISFLCCTKPFILETKKSSPCGLNGWTSRHRQEWTLNLSVWFIEIRSVSFYYNNMLKRWQYFLIWSRCMFKCCNFVATLSYCSILFFQHWNSHYNIFITNSMSSALRDDGHLHV